MCAERLCKSGRSGDLRCAAELGECLHLDRVGVGQVLRQLVVELACHRLPPASFGARFPTGSLSHVATAFSPGSTWKDRSTILYSRSLEERYVVSGYLRASPPAGAACTD